jgi:DNA primase
MDIFNIIKSQIGIFDVVNEYTALKKAGVYWRAHCPFHSEKTPSFTVSPHKEIYYCFGCNSGGDVIAFIAKAEQCTPLEAARYLAEKYNVELPQTFANDNIQDKEHYFEVCAQVAKWTHAQLFINPSALSYLNQRGISQSSISYFKLGYMPRGLKEMQEFIRAMNEHHILVHDLIHHKILSQGKKVLYSPFEDRILFPIKDHLGRFCGFGGRTYKSDDTRPKYYNSHENPFFNKGSLLFGFDLAKKSIQNTKKVILVEGYTDCIALVQQGFSHTVATLGTACTIEHLRQLSHHAQEAIVMYDGDNAGQQALLRLSKLCWQTNLDLKIVILPSGADPASLVQEGCAIDPFIQKAELFFTFFVSTLTHHFSTLSLKEKVERSRVIIESIREIDDPLKQKILLSQASQALQIPLEHLITPPSSPPPLSSVSSSNQNKTSLETLEKMIVCAILQNIELLTDNEGDYLAHFLSDPFRTIIGQLYSLKKEHPHITFTDFFNCLTVEHQVLVSKLYLSQEEATSKATYTHMIDRLRRVHWKLIVRDTSKKLKAVESFTDGEQIGKIIEELHVLQQKILNKNNGKKGLIHDQIS